jgi:hypothetical protein
VDGCPDWWIRSERQTLRVLPETGAILFTIRVQMAPLSVLATRPDRAGDLLRWFNAPIGSTRRHQLGGAFNSLEEWLRRVAFSG